MRQEELMRYLLTQSGVSADQRLNGLSMIDQMSFEDLESFRGSFRKAVKTLEAARRKDCIEQALQEPRISYLLHQSVLDAYAKLQTREITQFHDYWIDWILEAFDQALQTPRAYFTASELNLRALLAPAAEMNDGPNGVTESNTIKDDTLVVELETDSIVVRLDQIYSSMCWGIGVKPSEPTAEAALVGLIVANAQRDFAQSLRSLQKLEVSNPNWINIEPLKYGQESESFMFERLMHDILNEDRQRARMAPLHEDVVQKTDLRVHLPGLPRKRGSRVQVSFAVSGDISRAKKAAMHYPDEVVLISPFTLAEYVSHCHGDDTVVAWSTFWSLFGTTITTTEELASALRESFRDAMRRSHEHPLGAMHFVNPEVRKLVVSCIANQARACHAALRSREERRGTHRYRYRQKR